MIRIRLLGLFEATRQDGTSVRPPGRRSLCLLACLAQARWQRQELAALLWHGRAPEQARGSLRQELVRLRRAFGPLLDECRGDPQRMPGLAPDRVEVDLDRFRAAAADPMRAMQAVALYRGEFLQDVVVQPEDPFAAWLESNRQAVREMAVACLRCLLCSGEASESIARRLIELVPNSEEAHIWLLRHFAERGDVARAFEGYHAYAEAMRSTGREPSKEVTAWLEHLMLARHRSHGASGTRLDMTEWLRRLRRTEDRPRPPELHPLATISDRPSIVILPYVDLSPGARRAPLADGMTEEATNALARMPGFFVAARQSAMAYLGAPVDVRLIAAELGVRYVVEGSIERRNGRLRVNTRLIDGGSGLHLWVDTQERTTRDVLEVRDEIVQAISARLLPSLLSSEIRLALQRPTEHLDAWGWMLRAQSTLMSMGRRDGLASAIEPLQRALQLDPAYAMAHAFLGAIYTWRTLSYAFPDPAVERAMAREHADKALEMAPDNPFVLANCAETAIYSEGDLDKGVALLELAVTLNPNDPNGLALLGHARRLIGEDARNSLAVIEQAMRLSPRDPRSFAWLHYASWCYWKLDELKEMETASRRSIELYPNYPHSWIALACALGLLDRVRDAREAGRVLRELQPRFRAAHFYDAARVFYGRRFAGRVAVEYRQLRAVLNRATG
jgi:TolB-like protein/DNA-binding SARP family transcriptional activator/cytochrome c-type biogenesis protein CcmH/NrfG